MIIEKLGFLKKYITEGGQTKEVEAFCTLCTNSHRHNVLRLLDILPIFPLITSETKHDYYL